MPDNEAKLEFKFKENHAGKLVCPIALQSAKANRTAPMFLASNLAGALMRAGHQVHIEEPGFIVYDGPMPLK